jgi:hypothetical protein
MERLDEEKIEILRRWGEGLERDEREEIRAAGRAILLLIDEIDRLHVELWNERTGAGAATPAAEDDELIETATDVESSLRARLRQLRRRRSEPDVAPPETSA